MVQFISEASYSEQTKRAALKYNRVALNVILPNYTKTRTDSWYLYGRSILFLWYKRMWSFAVKRIFLRKRLWVFAVGRKMGMLRRPSCEGLFESYSGKRHFYEEGPCVLPMLCMLQHPHSGQTQISVFHTALSSSAIDRPVYLALNRWCPCSVKISFRFLLFPRLFRNP